MYKNKKSRLKAVLAFAVALVFVLPGSAVFANDNETEIENQSVVGVPITQTCITSVEATKEKILPTQFTTTSEQTLGVDFPLFSTENDCQNPGIVTDGLGNILVLTEEDVSTTNIWGRWSTDSGENWIDEGSITGWQFIDNVEKPKIDYKEGMTSWGTLVPGHDLYAVAFYIDFPDITDPSVPSPTSPQGWTAWSVDWEEAWDFSWFDSADVACYPYTPGTSPSANFFGIVAITGDRPPGGGMDEDDTFMFSFMEASGQVIIVSFYNMDEDVEKISCDIDQSLGQFYMAMEYVSETNPADNGTLFIKAPPLAPNDDWWKGSFPGFTFSGVSNPNMVAADNSVYIVGETAENDIVCLYSSNAGASFDSSDVTTTDENESHPTVAIVEDNVICSYIRDGDLYVSISTDGGQTWTETIDPINDEPGTVVDRYCSAAMDGPYAAWTDERNNPTEIYFDVTTAPRDYPVLNITEVKGGLVVKATIKNDGKANATNVSWTIKVTGGIFGFININKSGVIPTLAVGAEETVKSGIFFGLGKIVVEITAVCDEGSSDSETKTGTQIIIFTKIS